MPVFQELIMSGYPDVAAGWTLGSRYLTPILPLLVLPDGMGAAKVPRIAVMLGLLSIVATGGATLPDGRPPIGVDNPLFKFYMPEFLAGNFTHNLGELIGLKRHLSMVPLLLVFCCGVLYLWRQLDAKEIVAEPTREAQQNTIVRIDIE